MGKPCSDDLRSRVAAAVVGGQTVCAVAGVFGVSIASAAKPMGGMRRAVLADERTWLLARVREVPDLTLRALAAELAGRGVVVSHWAVWKLLASESITCKKKHPASRAGPARHRAAARAVAAAARPA